MQAQPNKSEEEAEKPVPKYLQHCQAKGCGKPGDIYTDMLFPICLCPEHSKMRRERKNR
jgi:hypothetical protein